MAASAIDVRFAGLPLLVAQSTSAFNAGDQLKVGSREKTVAQLGSADAANKCIGVAANTGLSGDQCSFVPIGPLVTGTSDGTAAINAGDAITNSSTTAGAVKSGTGSFLGRAWTAVANGQTTGVAYFAGGAADAVLGGSTTLATTYADGAVATDQTMSIGAGNGGAIQVKGSGAGTGQLLVVKDSSSNNLLNIQDNALQLIQSGVPDGAAAVGTAIDTINSLANASAKIISFRNAGSEQIYVRKDGFIGASGVSSGILIGFNITIGGNSAVLPGSAGSPTDNQQLLGSVTYSWVSIWTYWTATRSGGPLSITANAITPTSGFHTVGTGLLKTINTTNVPGAGARLTIVPTGAYTYDATGNINLPAGGGTAVISKIMDFIWDGTKWSPSY